VGRLRPDPLRLMANTLLHAWARRLLLLASFVLALLSPRAARAIEYEVFIDVDSEEELYDLYITDQISEDTFNTLVELRRRGVDLNEADRDQLYSLPNLTYDDVDAILAYREEVGVIHAPGDLVAAGVLTPDKLRSILTFIQAYDTRRKLTATHGWIRYQTAWSQQDRTVPPMTLQARVTTLRELTLGFAGLVSRQRPGNPVWDPTREAMMAPEMKPRISVPKYYVQWDNDRFGIIAGSYRIGFGQRLTFDNTDRYTPNGFFLDDAVFRPRDLGRLCRESAGELPQTPCPQGADDPQYYGTKDFRWRDSLRGLALGAKHLSLPVGWLQLYGFGSWQSKQIYQYQVRDTDRCPDALADDEDACSAPTVLVARDDQDRFEPTSAHKTQTLPNMYEEFVGGGNFSWFYDRRTHVGVTGYGATALWKVGGAELDFQDWSTTPFGGAWGAIGADMAWGHRWSDLGLEVARSFDSMTSATDESYGGGGYAGILRQTSTFGTSELELTARYYDRNYANPFAGPISQPDKFDGNRARDEAGGRIRYTGRLGDRLDLRGLADVWVQPSQLSPKMLTYLRGDIDVNDWFRPGLWLQYRNVDLRPGPNFKVGCVNDGSELDQNPANEDGTPNYRSGCLAEMGRITARLGFRPLKGKLSITAQYQHEFIDDPSLQRKEQADLCELDPSSPFCQVSACVDDFDPDMPSMVPGACGMSCGGDGEPACVNVCRENPNHPLCVAECADDPTNLSCQARLRQDAAATLIIRAQPLPAFRITARLRYLFEDVANNSYYEQSLWTYVALSYVIKRVFLIRLRYDFVTWLDERENTGNRVPNPEHRLRLQLEARF
jgi:hypothetical protein